jgi:RHS repeat-associated protein
MPDIWFAGQLIMNANNAAFTDRVGTDRASGARFMPYGDEITSTGNDREKFATYTRDSYSGLDYADQRFYASTYGRFNTPDPYMGSGDPSAPGSWNRYAYALGDPTNGNDPTGLNSNFCLSDKGLVACPDQGNNQGTLSPIAPPLSIAPSTAPVLISQGPVAPVAAEPVIQLLPVANAPTVPIVSGDPSVLTSLPVPPTGAALDTVSLSGQMSYAGAGSPLGKIQQVSQPYAPGSTAAWTVNSYDRIGHTRP